MATSKTDHMNLKALNALEITQLAQEFEKCCGSSRWVAGMLEARPYKSMEDLMLTAERIWLNLEEKDWLEAFLHHPKIGDVDSIRKKFSSTAAWAGQEQKGITNASESMIASLARGNEAYEKKNGFIFLICATDKNADEMLAALDHRLHNNRALEIKNAVQEQNKITKLRLEKWIKTL